MISYSLGMFLVWAVPLGTMAILLWSMWFFLSPLVSGKVDGDWGRRLNDHYYGLRRKLYDWAYARQVEKDRVARERNTR